MLANDMLFRQQVWGRIGACACAELIAHQTYSQVRARGTGSLSADTEAMSVGFK